MIDPTEERFKRMLARLKANCEDKNGPGSFEHTVARGRILMSKRAEELTDAEREFLRSPAPNKRH